MRTSLTLCCYRVAKVTAAAATTAEVAAVAIAAVAERADISAAAATAKPRHNLTLRRAPLLLLLLLLLLLWYVSRVDACAHYNWKSSLGRCLLWLAMLQWQLQLLLLL
jgi:hypothetical protein